MARTLLCFGDSNTHGSVPRLRGQAGRHGPDIRWPTVAAQALGAGWVLAEDGLPGRTTCRPCPVMGDFMDGRDGLRIALRCQWPVDVMTLMLGTNDLKRRFDASAEAIAAGIAGLLDITLKEGIETGPPKILLIAPAPVVEVGGFAVEFRGAAEKSARLAPLLAEVAVDYGCAFLDARAHVKVHPEEGVHWDAEAHKGFGKVVAEKIGALA